MPWCAILIAPIRADAPSGCPVAGHFTLNAAICRHAIHGKVIHRACMEGRDLVGIQIGRAVRLRSELRFRPGDVLEAETTVLHPGFIGTEVVSYGRHRQRFATNKHSLYAMLPAQPPKLCRGVVAWKETLNMWIRSARMWSRN